MRAISYQRMGDDHEQGVTNDGYVGTARSARLKSSRGTDGDTTSRSFDHEEAARRRAQCLRSGPFRLAGHLLDGWHEVRHAAALALTLSYDAHLDSRKPSGCASVIRLPAN